MGSVEEVDEVPYDLLFDANDVGSDSVVECLISQGPRADDPSFDPEPGDWLIAGDDEGPPVRARVVQREGNRIAVQLDLGSAKPVTA